jgi:hypothetical protein
MSSFIGFAPADHPRFATMVVLDEPADDYAARTAAPVWSEIMQSALIQYAVPSNDAADTQFDQAQASARSKGVACGVPHGADLIQAVQDRARRAAAAAQAAKAAKAKKTPRPGAAGSLRSDPSPSN